MLLCCSSVLASARRRHRFRPPATRAEASTLVTTDSELSAMDLRGYEHAKFELSEVLQAIAAENVVKDTRALQERLQDLLARLAEDRFNLVVAGRFSRGKSSLMNAILGTDRLPTGIVPLTSVITTVSYGTTELVTLTYRESRTRYGDLTRQTSTVRHATGQSRKSSRHFDCQHPASCRHTSPGFLLRRHTRPGVSRSRKHPHDESLSARGRRPIACNRLRKPAF